MDRFYQIRMRAGSAGEDLAEAVWESNHVGIWYGAWTPDEYQQSRDLTPQDRLRTLTEINRKNGIDWRYTHASLAVVRRFYALNPDDWICTCFNGRIHMGRVTGHVERGDIRFDRGGEIFKWRIIQRLKSFQVSDLPACFRLVQAGARGTLFQMRSYEGMMRVLAANDNEIKVADHLRRLEWDEWLRFLGPQGWESLCLGFLILEHNFVPTGLTIGGTLKDFDIIGADNRTGEMIYCQCKKDLTRLEAPPAEFLNAVEAIMGRSKVFLFAYGGCQKCPSCVRPITGEDIKKWFDGSQKAQNYRSLINRG